MPWQSLEGLGVDKNRGQLPVSRGQDLSTWYPGGLKQELMIRGCLHVSPTVRWRRRRGQGASRSLCWEERMVPEPAARGTWAVCDCLGAGPVTLVTVW